MRYGAVGCGSAIPNGYKIGLIFEMSENANCVAKKSHHVSFDSNGHWTVRATGATKAAKAFSSQEEAISYACSKASQHGTNIYIHRPGGTVKDKLTSEKIKKILSKEIHI